eukprot:COSAG02_NODE_62_length_43372_cov_14.404710_9_plen_260_part_00
MLNLHVTESAEIELPGLLVRITDTINGTGNATDIDDDLWDPGDLQVTIPGLGDVGMDVWSPFFGTLMAMTACCLFVVISAVLEKMFMCIGGEAIHSAIDEQKRINEELHRIIQVVGPIVDHAESMKSGDDSDEKSSNSPEKKKDKLIQLVTNDGEPMTAPEFMGNISEILRELAADARIKSVGEKAGKAVMNKAGGKKGAAMMSVGEGAYKHSHTDDQQQQKKKKGDKRGNKKTSSVRCFLRQQAMSIIIETRRVVDRT